MTKLTRLSLACLFAVAVPAQAGFLDAVVSAGAGMGAGAAPPQATAPQIDHAQIERMANELMDSLGVSTKTKNAKRAEVVRKLETLVGAQLQMQASPVAGMPAVANPLALLGNAGGNASKAIQIVSFLAENPDLLNQIKGMATNGANGADMSRALNAIAARMAKKNPNGAQIVKFMADNPEITSQALGLAAQAGSGAASAGDGLVSGLKNMFGGSGNGGDAAAASPPPAKDAGGGEGGFFSSLKEKLQNAKQSGSSDPSTPASAFGGDPSF